MSILMIPYRWANPFGESRVLGVVLEKRLKAVCVSSKSLTLNLAYGKEQKTRAKPASLNSCARGQWSHGSLTSEPSFQSTGDFGGRDHLVGSGFGLGTFSLRFRSFSSGSGRNLLPFRMGVFCGYVFVCIGYEKSRSEAQFDRIIQRWLIPCLLDSHSLMERGNVHITRHLICLTPKFPISTCPLPLGEMAPQHSCSFVHVDVT